MKKCLSTGKSMFFHESDAKEVAEKFSRGSAIGDMMTYRCMFCDTWHLTHHKYKTRRKQK